MAYPLILYHNLLDTASSVTATSTATGYSVDNLKDRLTFTRWTATSTSDQYITIDMGASVTTRPNCLAISGHNLYTADALIAVARSSDGVSWGGGIAPSMQPTNFGRDQTMICPIGGSGDYRYWRVEITSLGTTPYIGALCLGKRVDFTEYMDFGFDPRDITLVSRTATSAGGNLLPTVVEHIAQKCVLKFGPAGLARTGFWDTTGTPSWDQFVRSYWSKGLPFWFAPDTDNMTTDHYYCRPRQNSHLTSPIHLPTRRQLKFEFDVLAEGLQESGV